MRPPHQTLLSRLLGFFRGLFGPPPRQLPPIMAPPTLPPRPARIEVVATRSQHNPWEALTEFGPEERTTLIEKPARPTSPGLIGDQRDDRRDDTYADRRDGPRARPEATRPSPRSPLR